jgi:hypothetical protein
MWGSPSGDRWRVIKSLSESPAVQTVAKANWTGAFGWAQGRTENGVAAQASHG